MGSQKKPHIVIFPSPGMGHLIPFFEFAQRMATDHGFSVTFITLQWMVSPAQTAEIRRLASSAREIHFVDLVPPQEDDSEKNYLIRVFNIMEKSKAPLEELLGSLQDVSAFVTDLFCTAMVEVSAALHIPAYVLVTASASNVCIMLYHPTIDANIKESLKDKDGPVDIPGLPSMPARYFPDPMQLRADPIYHLFLRHSYRLCKADGILINTFQDLESGSLRALLDGKLLPQGFHKMPQIYAVGPLISSASEGETEKSPCLEWLDRQPGASVVYICFGSVGFMSAEQTRELAVGLEASGHRFLWALRLPPALSGSDLLPPGFQSRTRDRGLVWTSWAPQIDVLSHPATGGFLTHCGWNSILESVSFGVPMIAWPLQAEQKTNGFFLVKEIGAAIEPEWGAEWWVGKEAVERAVRELMEGEGGRKVRARACELKERAEKALVESSREAFATVVALWKERVAA